MIYTMERFVTMVRIITDSAADFEPAELERLTVTCIPLTVMFGEQEYHENIDLSKERFYELLLSNEELPKTAQASPEILLNLFTDAMEAGEEAVYITLSSALSGTYQNACMIRDMAGGKGLHVVDSLHATGGQRLLVEHAVKLRDEGKSASEIVEAVKFLQGRIVLYACIDTLEYLYKGGRISHTAYTIGSLAQIKPIITVNTAGQVDVPGKTMGMRKGMVYLCKRLDLKPMDPAFPLYVMYTNKRYVAEELADRLRAQGLEIPDERIIAVGAAIGSHVGPEACGLVYVGAEAR